jgi:uncharacterized protein (TIRG00374 family)
MAKRYLFTGIIFVLWIVGFYLATGGFSGESLVEVLSRISPYSVILGFFFYTVATGTGMLVLYKTLGYLNVKAPKKGVAKAWIFGTFIDNIMPTITPVGEATMAYFLEKFYRISYSKSLAAIGMYVSSWGISVSIFATFSVILVQYFVGIPPEWFLPVVITIFFFVLITAGWMLLLTNKKLIGGIVCKLLMFYRRISNKIKKRKVTLERCVFDVEFERTYESLENVIKNKKEVATNVVLLGIPQIAHVFCIYFLILGFGVQVPFFSVLMIHIVSQVMGLLFLIPSGLGVYEGTSIAGLALTVGISQTAAFGAIFLYRLIFVWGTNFIGGLVGIMQGVEDTNKIPVAP